MIEESATRFNNGDWFKMSIDTDIPSCDVTGFIDGEPVDFSGGGSGIEVAQVNVINDGAVFPFIEYPRMLAIPNTDIAGLCVDQLLIGINDVVLADGAAILKFTSESLEGNVVTGSENIEIIDLGGLIIVVVTGDGTITFSVD